MTTQSYLDNMFELAATVAKRSKDPSTQVGCVIVDKDKVVLATGYNGLPMGVRDDPWRMERPQKYTMTSHAEMNAIALSARTGRRLEGGKIFITHAPCSICARLIIQAGLDEAHWKECNTTNMPENEFAVARMMLAEAGVRFKAWP